MTNAERLKRRKRIAVYLHRHTPREAVAHFEVDLTHVYAIIKEFHLTPVKGYKHGKR